MHLSFRSSVNSWECDENDHLNVRFYIEKHWQTLCGAVDAMGLQMLTLPEGLSAAVRVQHIRYLREARMATPLSGYAGVVAAGPSHIDVVTDLRHSFTEQSASTCVHRIAAASAEVEFVMPSEAGPRGIADEDSPYTSVSRSHLSSYGFRTIGLGTVQAYECAADVLMLHHYMGRLSDGMPHLWAALNEGIDDQREGGAVLEYRLRYHQPLRRGESFEINSGISAIGAKVQEFTHLMHHADDGALLMSAQALGVRLDLQARKAVTLSTERQTQMRTHLLAPI